VSQATYLLTTRAYTHVVTLARDTVFLLDATTSEARSRADSIWIGKLFPGRHPIVVVVTDLAWPHIAGLRFWAARGARIVTHERSRALLTQVLERRWTLAPDLLETIRPRSPIRLVTTATGLDLAGGAIRVRPIDGFASEGALMVLVGGDNLLWGSDYIQTVDTPSPYAREVVAAARRFGFAPAAAVAQHLPLTPWATVVKGSTGE
jgi:hypothetical protein